MTAPKPPKDITANTILNQLIMQYNQRLKIGNSKNLEAIDHASQQLAQGLIEKKQTVYKQVSRQPYASSDEAVLVSEIRKFFGIGSGDA